MKYYICEGTPNGEYNASSKPRKDIENILDSLNYKPLYIPTTQGIQTKKILKFKQLYQYYINNKIWKKEISKLKENDEIIIQYPLNNTILKFDKIIDYCNENNIITVILIHDLDSLRFLNMPRIVKEDKLVLNKSTYIISHNEKMTEKLISMGNDKRKIVNLSLFDYLYEDSSYHERKKIDPVIIAGNLSKEKAGYISELNTIKKSNFNLYGIGYSEDNIYPNITYKGAFKPDELIENLEGSFGLVWDGNSKDTCNGPYGEYLKYNNPHKVSLYLAAGLPVVVWNKSAISKFIEDNNLGISIGSLEEIPEEINNISYDQYNDMLVNVNKISNLIRTGNYTKKSILNLDNIIKKNNYPKN